VEAFTRGGALGPVNIAYSGVYQWWYTIDLQTNGDLYTGALFLLFLSAISLIAGWLHLQPKWKPSVSWFKNAESFEVKPLKSILRFKAPLRVSFFVWTVALGKILAHDNLRRQNIVVEWCCMCKKSRESIDYLLFHCDVAWNIWSYFLILFGVEWVMPRRVLNLLSS
jgi:hypothetical protein